MINFLEMGGYASYVWPSYGIVAVVMSLNIYYSYKRYNIMLHRLKEMHASTEDI